MRKLAFATLVGLALGAAAPTVVLAHQINMSVVRSQARQVASQELVTAVDADYFRIACSKHSSHLAYCRIRYYGGSVGHCYQSDSIRSAWQHGPQPSRLRQLRVAGRRLDPLD
jgi:hypothetical protein